MAEKNTYRKFTMESGCVVELTLNFYRLYQLKAKDPKSYDLYFKITENGLKDEFDIWMYVYVAYLCANLEKEKLEYQDFESFLMDVPDSREGMWRIYRELTGGKKKKAE